MATLKLHSDRWENERSVRPFLSSIKPEQVGPDGARLLFTLQFVKPGKGAAFIRTEWHLELDTKVRSLDVARWALERMSEVSEVHADDGSKKGLDDIGLALKIEEATKLLDRGPTSDAAGDDGEDAGDDREK